MTKDYAYLVMVNSENNNNKFYEATLNSDNSIDVRFGRVGMDGVKKHYAPYEKDFYNLIREKTNKGYEDNTLYHAKKSENTELKEALSYKPEENKDVQELMDLLISSSRAFMKNNYTVETTQITEKAIIDAEQDIAELREIAHSNNRNNKLYDFNCKLEEDLFHRIERKMSHVSDHLAKTEDDFEKIIVREQEMLDNLKGIIEQEKRVSGHTSTKDTTYLEANGLSVRPVTYKEEDQIISHLGKDYNGTDVERRYVKGFAVENGRTRSAYEQYKKDNHISEKSVKIFYHGSKVENWNSIMGQGLSLNPDAKVTGKMFGNGLYFAPESRKSLNYMDTKGSRWNNGQRDTGYLGLYAVALGRCWQTDRILPSDYGKRDLPHGYDSVFAKKNTPLKSGRGTAHLVNDEYIVYDQAACTIKYLLEMKDPSAPALSFNLDRKNLRDKLSEGLETLQKIPQGLRCEVQLESLPPEAVTEIASKITNGYDCDKLFIDYNIKKDRISLSVEDVCGNSKEIHPDLTSHDMAFLSREMKKSFVESEVDWKAMVKTASDIPTGKTVVSKTEPPQDKNEENKKQSRKTDIERKD